MFGSWFLAEPAAASMRLWRSRLVAATGGSLFQDTRRLLPRHTARGPAVMPPTAVCCGGGPFFPPK